MEVSGRSPQAKLWVLKSSALKYRAGGSMDYEFFKQINFKYFVQKLAPFNFLHLKVDLFLIKGGIWGR